jgi:hypothetical protein
MKATREKDHIILKCTPKEARCIAAACANTSEREYQHGTEAKMDAAKKIALQVASEFNAIAEIILSAASFIENV